MKRILVAFPNLFAFFFTFPSDAVLLQAFMVLRLVVIISSLSTFSDPVLDGFANKSKDMAQATDGKPGTKPVESLDVLCADK